MISAARGLGEWLFGWAVVVVAVGVIAVFLAFGMRLMRMHADDGKRMRVDEVTDEVVGIAAAQARKDKVDWDRMLDHLAMMGWDFGHDPNAPAAIKLRRELREMGIDVQAVPRRQA